MRRPKIPMRMLKFLRSERGQLFMLTAIVLPVLMGFTALSVDMGWLYVNKTREQRAADAAALAGALRRLNGGSADEGVSVAKEYAAKNGYNASAKNADGSDIVRAYWGPEPPSKFAAVANKDDYIEVKIRKTHQTFFIRVLSSKLANMTVFARAVSKVDPIEKNYAILVLNKDKCGALTATSNNDIYINDGGIIVNSDANLTCGNPICGACQDGSVGITANADGTCPVQDACTVDHYSGGDWYTCPNCTTSPPPTPVSAQVTDPLRCRTDLDPPAVDLWGPNKGSVNGINTADPGWKPPGTDPISTVCVAPPIPCPDVPIAPLPYPTYCNVLTSPDSGGTATKPAYRNLAGAGTTTLRPGVYWGGIKLNSSSHTVLFEPGIYVLAGGGGSLLNAGGLSYNSGDICPAAACKGVTFFNTTDPYADTAGDRLCGALNFAGSGALKLGAPADPPMGAGPPYPVALPWPDPPADILPSTKGWKNMMFWQSVTCNPQPEFKYGGSNGGTWDVSGIMYMPKAKLNVNGGAAFGAVQLIVDTFNFGGANDVTINYTPFVLAELPRVKLVE